MREEAGQAIEEEEGRLDLEDVAGDGKDKVSVVSGHTVVLHGGALVCLPGSS